MTTLVKEKVELQPAVVQEVQEAQEIDKSALCQKLCTTILETLLEAYTELKEKNPEKEQEFQKKIEELQTQIISR